MSPWVRLGCQFLSMSGERGPGTANCVLHHGGCLIHKCDHLLLGSSLFLREGVFRSLSMCLFSGWRTFVLSV